MLGLYVYPMHMLIWMMVSLEGLELYLLYVDEWRIFKRNAVKILSDQWMVIVCISAWMFQWLVDAF